MCSKNNLNNCFWCLQIRKMVRFIYLSVYSNVVHFSTPYYRMVFRAIWKTSTTQIGLIKHKCTLVYFT